MSVTLGQDAIVLSGKCGVEEAEMLVALMQAHRNLPVDLARVEWLHTALWQVIFAFKPSVTGAPSHGFIHDWLLPLLESDTSDTRAT